MSKHLEYKGYHGTIEPNLEDDTLFGKLAFIRDLVTYEARTLKALEKQFKISVNDYLADCEEHGKTPDKPFKGSFNIRSGPDLHREAALRAKGSLNAFVVEAIREKLDRESARK